MDGFDFMDQVSADFMRQVGRMVEAVMSFAPALAPYTHILWAGEQELCLREYTRRMNAGPWRWRRQSWRRLNIDQRTAARRWWLGYGRKALKWRQEV